MTDNNNLATKLAAIHELAYGDTKNTNPSFAHANERTLELAKDYFDTLMQIQNIIDDDYQDLPVDVIEFLEEAYPELKAAAIARKKTIESDYNRVIAGYDGDKFDHERARDIASYEPVYRAFWLEDWTTLPESFTDLVLAYHTKFENEQAAATSPNVFDDITDVVKFPYEGWQHLDGSTDYIPPHALSKHDVELVTKVVKIYKDASVFAKDPDNRVAFSEDASTMHAWLEKRAPSAEITRALLIDNVTDTDTTRVLLARADAMGIDEEEFKQKEAALFFKKDIDDEGLQRLSVVYTPEGEVHGTVAKEDNPKLPLFEAVDETKPFTIPTRATKHSVGFDIFVSEDVVLEPGDKPTKVHTNVKLTDAFPTDKWLGAYNRSSNFKRHIMLSNNTGVIDADYRGEIMAFVYNYGTEPVEIKAGDRIFQLIAHQAEYLGTEVDEARDGGFGSTGE